ncbi:MAG: AAA family ATPase [Polyangiaceae bacterium]|nr:AAA family ATPase [Polyangiaceae bacterium]
MLEFIDLKNVGPAHEMKMDLAPRLNLITGDNGLGKTLLLDAAWWALTRTWPLTWGGRGIVPDREGAAIEWREHRGDEVVSCRAEYNFADSRWGRTESSRSAGAKAHEESQLQGPLVLYLRVDGGISVHDPLRKGEDFRVPFGQRVWGTSNAYQFRDPDIWDGLAFSNSGKLVCEGLVRDVSRWAEQAGSPNFEQLSKLVEQLAGDEPFRLTRKVERVYVDDPRDFPVVAGPAGNIPVAHSPAGLRRILGLAYLVVWARREHTIAAELKKRAPNRSLVLLIDEVESHLHPKWQRTILPSILRALNQDQNLQVIATTHSPMVLASVEPLFDVDKDAWFDMDLERRQAVLRKRPYVRHGEIGNWLTSDAFDLKEPRSLEGEQAIVAAQAVLDAPTPSAKAIQDADKQLRKAGLPDIDPFWVQWGYFKQRHTAAPKEYTVKGKSNGKRERKP